MAERIAPPGGLRRFIRRVARRQVTALSLAGLLLVLATATALAVTGDFTQPAGTGGCVSETGAGGCADGHAVNPGTGGGPVSVAVSPDRKSVYVASSEACCPDLPDDSALVRFNRNTATGAISEPAGIAGCISDSGAGPCANGRALVQARAVAVSPDGKSVYVASEGGGGAVAHFVRNPTTGAISQPAGEAGCISNPSSVAPEPCADGHGLFAAALAVSPDGKNVYVTGSRTVVRLNRNTTTGAITEPAGTAGCISEDGSFGCADGHGLDGAFVSGLAVSPDGKNVYVTSGRGDSGGTVVRLDRNTTTGAISEPAGTAGCVSEDQSPCQSGHALESPYSVVVSPDGKNLYVTSFRDNAVARLNRKTTTGAIFQPQGNCISEDGSFGCADGHGLNGARGLSVSPDGKTLYVGSDTSRAVARIDRLPDGRISQPSGSRGCINRDGSNRCADGHGFGKDSYSTAVAPGGRSVYATSGLSGSVMRFKRAP
jgi:DNA-binding beta-propeller fold protein YncE